MAVDYWNQGYTTEAAKACIEFGFDYFKLRKITSRYLSTNLASGRVMEKCGMKREGILREHQRKNDTFHDIVEYGLLKSES